MKTRLAAFALILVLAPLPALAAAPLPALAAADARACAPVERPELGGDACERPDGLFEVTLDDGTRLLTHGADPAPDPEPGFVTLAERAPACATDWYQHVLYGRPASSPDRSAQVKAQIQAAIRRMNYVLNQEAQESGGVTADFKVLCDGAGQVRVDSFTVPSTSTSFSVVVNAARAAGFHSDRADYTIFYDADGGAVCGVGSFAYDDRLTVHNANNVGGAYGISYRPCWDGRTPMHENGHNQGAVQRMAPWSDLTGHCLEGQDIMCYPTSAVLVLCRDRVHYDCWNNTYFDAQPEPNEWLATHWNIGSRLNRFIRFGDTG